MGKIIRNGNYCVYIHTSPSGKRYVGQTSETKPEYRWRYGCGYLYKNQNGEYKQPAFAHAILKYGFDNFEHEIIASHLTKDEADNFEKLLIKKLDTTNPKHGYNCNDGGSNGSLSERTRKKISESLKGEKHPMYGKHHSEKTKNKISESCKVNGRAIVQYDLYGNLIKVWNSMIDAATALGVSKSALWRCCNNKSKTSGGFIWKYYKDAEIAI